eukprot:scaffold3054_cov129-Cylindrotheca_fusiformis.AAC.17
MATNPYRPTSAAHRTTMTSTTNQRYLLFALFACTTLAFLFWESPQTTSSIETGHPICPGSPARVHAKCEMKVRIPQAKCANVLEEITLRLKHENGWVDPHNNGKYELLSSTPATDENGQRVTFVQASRQTGNAKYTDLMNIQFTQGDGCVLETCSESQVTSILDFSTNYCSLHNLFCGEASCNPIKHEFVGYEEEYENCSQNVVSKCSA